MNRALAIGWTVLFVAAWGSVLIAVATRNWPMVAIQTMVTVAAGFMAYTRWTGK
jgi:hypothetical protein